MIHASNIDNIAFPIQYSSHSSEQPNYQTTPPTSSPNYFTYDVIFLLSIVQPNETIKVFEDSPEDDSGKSDKSYESNDCEEASSFSYYDPTFLKSFEPRELYDLQEPEDTSIINDIQKHLDGEIYPKHFSSTSHSQEYELSINITVVAPPSSSKPTSTSTESQAQTHLSETASSIITDDIT